MNQNKFLPAPFMTSDPAAIAAAEGAKARIQAAYIMALQKPRNVDQARINIIEACRRPEFAKKVEFSKPVGTRKIRGPSIRLTETALQCWQNVDTETQVIYEDDHVRRIKIRVLDLETNAAFSKDINIAKTVERKNPADREVVSERMNSRGEKVYIVLATDDELANKEGALTSKAIRNEGLRLIPQDIIDEALMTARQTLADEDARDPNAAKKTVLDSFATIGIKPIELERYLNHPLDTMSPAEREDLRGVYRAIRDGESTWQEFVKPKEEPKPPAPAIDPKTGEVIDRYAAKGQSGDLKGKAGTSTTAPQDEGGELERLEKLGKSTAATKVYDTIKGTRKLFAEYVRANLDIIRDDMSTLERENLKTKWLRSAREEVNGVKKDEPWPLDKPEEQEAGGEAPEAETAPWEDQGGGGEAKPNGKNGFVHCPKTDQRVAGALCHNCVDRQDCEETKHFLSECKTFRDLLPPVVFRSVLMEQGGIADPKKIPIAKFTEVLVELNAAVDQINA